MRAGPRRRPIVVLPNGKVEKKDSSEAKFFESIYDLGDGDIDFPACHRILKAGQLQGLELR